MTPFLLFLTGVSLACVGVSGAIFFRDRARRAFLGLAALGFFVVGVVSGYRGNICFAVFWMLAAAACIPFTRSPRAEAQNG